MCDKAVDNYPHALEFVPECYETPKICDKAVTHPSINKYVPECYKISSLRHWNTGLVFIGVSLTSWGEVASLVLVSHPSSDGIKIKIPYGVDVLLLLDQLRPT